MAGSHEVRGSIPLGSTTDTRGARRRRRAPLFASGPIGQKVCLIQGRRRGPAPLSRSPGLVGPIQAPGRKARPRRAWASRGRGARARPPRARGGRAGPVRAHRGDLRQGGDAFGARTPRPRRARRGRLAQGRQTPEGGAKAVDGIGADSDSAAAGSRTPASAACRRRSTSGGPSPAGAARATTPPSSPPAGSRRRGSPIGGRPPARTRPPPRRSRRRRRLIYKMVGMPTISLPASLGRLPRRRPKWANRGERPAPLPMRRKKRRERRNSYLANP